MFCEEARLKKNILPSVSMRSTAVFSLLGFWKGNNSALLLGVIVVLVIVIFVWLIFRRRHDVFPEIKFEAESPAPEKDMTIIENQPDEVVRSASFPGIYGKIEEIKGVIDTIGKAENLHIKTIVITNRESIKDIISPTKVNRGSIKHIISPTKVIKMQPKTLLSLTSK